MKKFEKQKKQLRGLILKSLQTHLGEAVSDLRCHWSDSRIWSEDDLHTARYLYITFTPPIAVQRKVFNHFVKTGKTFIMMNEPTPWVPTMKDDPFKPLQDVFGFKYHQFSLRWSTWTHSLMINLTSGFVKNLMREEALNKLLNE
jgi:hypothetical protein